MRRGSEDMVSKDGSDVKVAESINPSDKSSSRRRKGRLVEVCRLWL